MEREESQTPTAHDISAGTLLRRAREAAGLHVAALAVSLKVPVRKLEALEADRYDEMPDAVFVRGLASSVCRVLKIDPQPVLERLPQSATPRLVRVSDGLNTPFRAPGDGAPPSWLDYARQPVFLAVFALLLGAVVMILLPSARKDDKPAAVAQPASETVVAPVAPPPVAEAAAMPAAPASAALPAVAVPPPAATPAPTASAAMLPAAALAKPSASSAAPAASAATAAVAADTAPATSGLVVIRARGETWVNVTDAKGVSVLNKTLAAGESAGASGVLPLKVTIGRVDATDVLVRNKPFDLRSVSRDNVARFEVK